jgi:hypothetical protein
VGGFWYNENSANGTKTLLVAVFGVPATTVDPLPATVPEYGPAVEVTLTVVAPGPVVCNGNDAEASEKVLAAALKLKTFTLAVLLAVSVIWMLVKVPSVVSNAGSTKLSMNWLACCGVTCVHVCSEANSEPDPANIAIAINAIDFFINPPVSSTTSDD